jgi:hypothetical protein
LRYIGAIGLVGHDSDIALLACGAHRDSASDCNPNASYVDGNVSNVIDETENLWVAEKTGVLREA